MCGCVGTSWAWCEHRDACVCASMCVCIHVAFMNVVMASIDIYVLDENENVVVCVCSLVGGSEVECCVVCECASVLACMYATCVSVCVLLYAWVVRGGVMENMGT